MITFKNALKALFLVAISGVADGYFGEAAGVTNQPTEEVIEFKKSWQIPIILALTPVVWGQWCLSLQKIPRTCPLRHLCFSAQHPHSLAVAMEQEKNSLSRELSPDLAPYHCTACHGDEDWSHSHPIRGRAKSRSLSASPALGSTKEFRRTRSLHGPCPVTTFGPKACVLQNPQTIMHIQDPASQRLTWNKAPKSVLVVKKIRDASLLQPFKELCVYLMEENNMIVYVEKKVLEDPAIVSDENFGPVKKKFCTFREDYDDISNQIDFIICLGGDGTLLYASSLFQVLNEVVIDRGPSSYLSNVDVYLDGHLITTVQGDGVIVSTPTGSTAYAAAAGASMIHPNVPAIMITPICPHSLSFRPIVVPAGVELKITLSPEARNTVWVSFDGRKRQEIGHGDSISITTSCYPLPSICVQDPVRDWFESLAQCLHWNVRKKQTHFTEEEDDEEGEEVQG
ncbi:NAD kinase isoform X3 [Loxodonta africana]|uniref:NAD kinase isoform X3 n=1 Tax=Loxodonta africana TaxID=9785 RepID=UPI0030CC7C62